jgi:hypothetical protein
MKKLALCFFSTALLIASANAGLAADGTISCENGATLTIDGGNTTGAVDLTFEPSTNVNIQGFVQDGGAEYVFQTWHSQVVAKDSGKAFGVTSLTNVTYWLDISASDHEMADLEVDWTSNILSSWKTM